MGSARNGSCMVLSYWFCVVGGRGHAEPRSRVYLTCIYGNTMSSAIYLFNNPSGGMQNRPMFLIHIND